MPQGIPATLLIDLTTKPPSGFESANSWLVVGKQLIHYTFILAKQCIKYLKAFPKIIHCASQPWICCFTIDCFEKIALQFCTMKGVKETFIFRVFLKETLSRSIFSFWFKMVWCHHNFRSSLSVAQSNGPRGTWKF